MRGTGPRLAVDLRRGHLDGVIGQKGKGPGCQSSRDESHASSDGTGCDPGRRYSPVDEARKRETMYFGRLSGIKGSLGMVGGILCGHCKRRHESVEGVRQCSLRSFGGSSDAPTHANPDERQGTVRPSQPSSGQGNVEIEARTPGWTESGPARKGLHSRGRKGPQYREPKHPSEYGRVTIGRPPRPERRVPGGGQCNACGAVYGSDGRCGCS